MTCHQCLIKWVQGGSRISGGGTRYYISEVSDDGTEWSSRPSIAETVLNGEALCMFHLKAVWADILFALKKEEWNQYD